jgi:hypothetical protein
MHATVESDIYNGYYIPKGMQFRLRLVDFVLTCSTGAIITPNIW